MAGGSGRPHDDEAELDSAPAGVAGALRANIGPLAARVKPTTGSMVAYGYFLNHGPYSGYPNGGLEHRLAMVPPTNPGLPTNPLIDQPGRDNPTWHGDQARPAR